MTHTIHVLNGDALLSQFPSSIEGSKIIMRECLVDGTVVAKDLQDFVSKRALFMQENYGTPIETYIEKSVPELSKLALLRGTQDIHLWFEDDLFCQVNFWFICSLLRKNKVQTAHWIRPEDNLQFGFGGCSEQGLVEIYNQKISLGEIEIKILAQLWTHYKNKDLTSLKKAIGWLPKKLKPIGPAIAAEIDRHQLDNPFGRPGSFILERLNENPSVSFGEVFEAFRKELSVYGFGDLQVQRMFDQLKSGFN